MPQRPDRRVRRTRTALQEALLSLMAERGYDAVTVQDVIDHADVGRSTFYTHYGDKADLLTDTLARLRTALRPATGGRAPDRRRPLRFSREMFGHVHEQQPLLRALLGAPGAGAVVGRVELMLTDVVRGELDALAGPTGPARVPLDLLTDSVVAAFLATLRWWVADGFRQPPDQLESWFQTMVAPGIRAAVPPPG
jgi:AcrR family transcriptional regulator